MTLKINFREYCVNPRLIITFIPNVSTGCSNSEDRKLAVKGYIFNEKSSLIENPRGSLLAENRGLGLTSCKYPAQNISHTLFE